MAQKYVHFYMNLPQMPWGRSLSDAPQAGQGYPLNAVHRTNTEKPPESGAPSELSERTEAQVALNGQPIIMTPTRVGPTTPTRARRLVDASVDPTEARR
jgi:hypothetical protein